MSTSVIRSELLGWFDRHQRDLPWRRTRDPYAIWLSEVMLQQTQVATVIPYFHRFLARFPTAASMAAAPLEDVLTLWKGLGYYSRARHLHRAAQEIVERFGGVLPDSVLALESLPTFGPYTTGAVASIAFGLEVPLVDGNVARVLTRIFAVEGTPGDRVREAALWTWAGVLVKGERPGDFNQSLMELGALICRPVDPLCLVCPVRPRCQALEQGRTAELPPPKVRAARQALALALGVWEREGTLLFARRAESGLFGGLWELPSVAAVDAPADLALAFSDLLGVDIRLGPALGQVKRTLTHRDLSLALWKLEARGEPKLHAPYVDLRWADADAARALGMSTAMQRALDAACVSLRADGASTF